MDSELNSKPLVSISSITFNHVNYIEKALNGFLMQKTNFKFEVLIHDDASTDGTEEIIRDFERRYPAIIKPLYEETNQWVKGRKGSAVFNFPRAKGKYIALCEGDDYWTDPLKLQKQVDFMEANQEYTGCFHDTLVKFEGNPSSEFKLWRNYDRQTFTVLDTISTIALFHTSSFLFKSESLTLPSWIGKVQSCDMALFALIANKGLIRRIDQSMSVYRKHEGGITNTISLISYHKNRIILFKHLRGSCKHENHSKIKEVIQYHRKELNKIQKQTLKSRLKNLLKI